MPICSTWLSDWLAQILVGQDVREDHAEQTARLLVRADLRGYDAHGAVRIVDYVQRLRSGHVNPAAEARLSWSNGALLVDGDLGLGQAIAAAALENAIERARTTAVVPCLIRAAGHMGAMGIYALLIAEQGLLGLACQETRPVLWPEGASRRAIGNNPLAFAAPLRERAPLVFDMASSAVSHGRLMSLIGEGAPIAQGWVNDSRGLPTTDPSAALSGGLAPLGGHKGIGLAMLVQCLAGSLTGATLRNDDPSADGSSAGNIGALFLVINPDMVIERSMFDRAMSQWLDYFLGSFPDGGRYPGQRSAEIEAKRRVSGIPLSPGVLSRLAELGRAVDLPFSPP